MEDVYKFLVTMKDGYAEMVKAKNEDIAKIQCAHLKVLHGEVANVERFNLHNRPIKEKVKPVTNAVAPKSGGVIERNDGQVDYESPLNIVTQEELEEKAISLIITFGLSKAISHCFEMIIEHSSLGNKDRVDFWNKVLKEIK